MTSNVPVVCCRSPDRRPGWAGHPPARKRARACMPAAASAASRSAPTRSMGARSPAGSLAASRCRSSWTPRSRSCSLPIRSHGRTPARASRSRRRARQLAERDRLSVITRFDKEREVSSSLSAVVIIHPPANKRVTPGLIVGVIEPARAEPRDVYAGVHPGRRRSRSIPRSSAAPRPRPATSAARRSAPISLSRSRRTCRSFPMFATTTARSATRSTMPCGPRCGCSGGSESGQAQGSGLRAQGSGKIFEYVARRFCLSLEP